jgi:tetratricopeptide (TPR) repeat protein
MMAKSQPARALDAYEKALRLNANTEVTIKLDNALRRAGRTAEADRRLDTWIGAHRDDTRVLSYRAEIWMGAREYKRAAAQLEALLKRQPGDVKALNNLALSYQGIGDPRALPIAEQALGAAGDNPDVMDTVGWMLADKSSGDKADLPRALTLLQKAHALAPKARDIRYHLAAVLYRCGARDDARKELEALAAGDMRFAQADEVRALLAEVRRGG